LILNLRQLSGYNAKGPNEAFIIGLLRKGEHMLIFLSFNYLRGVFHTIFFKG